MIAQVIVNHNSKQVDKVFDYRVPEELEDIMRIGMRVVVPFGRGNIQMEGYVMAIKERSRSKRLKDILRVSDELPVFNEKMLELIEYMHEKYLCSYLDLIHTIVPSGTTVKPEQWFIIKNNFDHELTDMQKNILKDISDNGGALDITRLMQRFGANVRVHLKKMCDDGILYDEYRDVVNVKDKTVTIVRLNEYAIENAEKIKLSLKRAKVQERIFDVLMSADDISLTDLVQFSDGSHNAVRALDKKGLLEFETRIVDRNFMMTSNIKKTAPPKLTDGQAKVLHEIEISDNREFLLHGVTGSGKTEVYMRIIERVIDDGKTAIMLVPEIALTPQTVARFVSRFGKRVAVFHSGLSMNERYDEWKKMRDGNVDIAVGARSAIFSPLDNIGVIIMDEEHEQSYKSEISPRYHTRDIARFRAKQYDAKLVLASATPSMESYYEARKGDYQLLTMTKRVNAAPMPPTYIVDMREELEQGNKSMFSRMLTDEIQKNLDNGEQTILFLNRRGFSTFVSCRNCGFVAKCPNCNISLTYHKNIDSLRCHYCGYSIQNYTVCPECGSKYIRYFGGGTQKVEDEVNRIFPQASVIRMDVDTTGRKMAHEKILNKFEKEKIDILIGTQMVSKGLDFENVTLVGVVSADTMLNIDDFRSSERTFSLLEQVAGRAGRAAKAGRAIVQTYSPDNAAIQLMQRHDYINFYKTEMRMRLAMWYPPFCDIVSILITGGNEGLVQQAAKYIRRNLKLLERVPQKIQVLGPVPATISKIKNKYRWRIIIKCENADNINSVLTDVVKACYNNKSYERISIVIDKNPNNMY